jgi:hypothetical protein
MGTYYRALICKLLHVVPVLLTYLIHQLDEAHNIKERATNTAKATFELKAKFRWCLSGTPLQNRVGELYSLIRFLGCDPFSHYYCMSSYFPLRSLFPIRRWFIQVRNALASLCTGSSAISGRVTVRLLSASLSFAPGLTYVQNADIVL